MAFTSEQRAAHNQKKRGIEIRECANMDRRLERLADPKLFLKGYFPRQFWRPFSRDQLEAMEVILDCIRYSTDEIVVAPRGDWKSETLKHLVIFSMLNCYLRYPLWIGATAGDAFERYDDIKNSFTNPELAEDFPEVCDPVIALQGNPQRATRQTFNGELTKLEWRADRVRFPVINEVPGTGQPSPYNGMKLTYRGLDGAIRGLNWEGERPDAALCDDLETRESAVSDGPKGQIAKRRRTLDHDVGGLGSSETIPRIVLSTVQNRICLTWQVLQDWGGKRYQGVYKWPDSERAIALRDEYIELRFADKKSGDKTYKESYDFYEKHQSEIEEGVELGNPHNKSSKFRKDGRPLELSAFQKILNHVADKGTTVADGWAYVNAEIQNDPDEGETQERLGLTAKKVSESLSGFARQEAPLQSHKVTVGIDIGNWRSHWVKIAWFGNATGVVLDYGILETTGMTPGASPSEVTQRLLPTLMRWRTEMLAMNPPEFCLVDSGSGSHKEAVYEFVRQCGGVFAPSKGFAKTKFNLGKQSRDRRLFHECYATKQDLEGVWLYDVNVEYWKHWVHERFSTPTFNEQNQMNDGSLSLFSDSDPRLHLPYGQHIVAEELTEIFIEGKGLMRKWHEHSKVNHWLDATALAACAGGVIGVRLVPRNETPAQIRNVPTKGNRQPQGDSGRYRQRAGGWVPGSKRR